MRKEKVIKNKYIYDEGKEKSWDLGITLIGWYNNNKTKQKTDCESRLVLESLV